MKTKYLTNWVLILILLISLILRLYNLSSNPPHLTPDEAALGYNAYSVLKTGRDEYGTLLPLIFKSFGDFKPGLYVYLTVPFVAIMGLSELSVRLPSALAGVFAVWLLYKIIQILFKEHTKVEILSLLASLSLAISPWHIHFSRGGWEVNLSLTLTLLGIYFFLMSFRHSKYLIFSALSFGLTLLAYQGAKLSTAIVILVLCSLYLEKVIKFKLSIILCSLVLGLFITLPVAVSLFMGGAGRLEVFSIFSYPRPKEYLQTFLDQGNEKPDNLNYYLFHPEWHNFVRGIAGRYFNHFSGRFLLFEGDWQNPRHSVPNHGMLLVIDGLSLLIGIFTLVRKKVDKKVALVFLWLFLSPLPAVLSKDQVHAVRALNMIIPLTIIISLGNFQVIEFINKLTNKIFKYVGYSLLVLLYVINYIYFVDAYFIHMPQHNSKFWEYGYKQIVQTLSQIRSNYKQIKVQQSYSQPYIFFLFYEKYDPGEYQKQARLKENEYGDVGQVEKLDNICFCPIDWSINRGDRGEIIVGDSIRIPDADTKDENQFRIINEVKYIDNSTAFRIIEVKP